MNSRGRVWGYWTEAKLRLLADYLDGFTTATKVKARERIYLDLFAGEGRGVSGTTGEEFDSSARIALDVDDPPFTQLHFCEVGTTADRLEHALRGDYPDRGFAVIKGDCNETVVDILAELRSAGLAWAPTFAFADPDGMELAWTTVDRLAEHKKDTSRFKTELWILFSSTGLMRVLKKDRVTLTEREQDQATRMYGSQRWQAIQTLRFDDEITPHEAREEFVNLYRWQLEHVLGYRWTHALEIKNLAGRPLYHMVFATDSDAGNDIMAWLYNQALGQMPSMRREARDRISGQQLLFELESDPPGAVYQYEAPWQPPT